MLLQGSHQRLPSPLQIVRPLLATVAVPGALVAQVLHGQRLAATEHARKGRMDERIIRQRDFIEQLAEPFQRLCRGQRRR